MKSLRVCLVTVAAVALLSVVANAHVLMLNPSGGESFEAGDTVIVEWVIQQDHGPNDWDLYFSDDDGQTWSVVQENMPKPQLTYAWEVPATPTTTARLRIVQDNEDPNPDYDNVCFPFAIRLYGVPTGSPATWIVLVLVLVTTTVLLLRKYRTAAIRS